MSCVSPPKTAYIEVSSRCNSLCQTCVLTFRGQKESRDLPWPDFLKIAEKLPPLEWVVLHGIGEPLLNKHLFEMVRHFKNKGSKVLFNSNAILLNGEKAKKLIASGLDEIRVSLDATTPKTYQKVRGVPCFDKVIQNLKRLSQEKILQGARTPKLSLWFTLMRENFDEANGLIPLAVHVGAQAVNLQRLVYFDLGLAKADQSLHGKLTEQEESVIKTIEAQAKLAKIELQASGSTAPHQSFAKTKEAYPWQACRRPWSSLYITANGKVLPCCFAPWVAKTESEITLGDLFQQSFVEIWNGTHYEHFRKAIRTETPFSCCVGCGVHWSL